LRFTGMQNGKLDLLVVAGLAVCVLAACNRRTLTAGAIKAAPDAAARDGANDDSGPPDVANADARDPDIDASPDGRSLAGPCGEATCLIDLFRTCVPEGSCGVHGRGAPGYLFWSTCYGNGVMVSTTTNQTDAGSSDDWTVTRDEYQQTLCYAVKGSAPTGSSMTYTITGANGEQVATGIASDQPGFVTVTCNGGEPTMVSSACLEAPVPTSICSHEGCPSGTGRVDAGPPDVADARDPDVDTSPDGQSLSGPCGEATCLIDLFQTCVPEGSCSAYGSGALGYLWLATCYANGVEVDTTVSDTDAGTGRIETWRAMRGRDRTLCYAVNGAAPTGSSMTYTITGANGEQVATGISSDQPGFVTVTCNGGQPTMVSNTCLEAPPPTGCSSGGCPPGTTGSRDAGATGGTTGGTDGSGGGGGGSTGAGGTTGGTGGSSGGAGGSTSTDTAATLRCTLPRGPDSEPGSTCETYCDDLRVMCKSTPGVPATSAECVSRCKADLTEAELCCRAAHLMNKTGSTACEEALGRGACP
jgi:hypothetical protein